MAMSEQEKRELGQRLKARYWQLTSEDLPEVAAARGWPVQEAHEFQRLILDTICHGVWYRKIAEPAVAHMTNSQLRKAVRLGEDLLNGARMLEALNVQSIQWRQAAKAGAEWGDEALAAYDE